MILPGPFGMFCIDVMGVVAEPPPVEFHHRDRAEYHLRSSSEPPILPVVISSLFMNDISPTRMVETDHAGLKDFG